MVFRGNKRRNKLEYLKLTIISVLFLSLQGCYTRFAKFETLPAEQVVTVLDSKGNLVREVRRNDTIHTPEGETCVWEQDALGYPFLHCYPRYYPREWYLYNKSPWWYRNDEHLYSADRCPAYYYFDENCECCRYYLNNPTLNRAESRSGQAKVSAGSATPVITGQAASPRRDTNVSVSATTRFSQSISPKQFFQNPVPVTTTVNSIKSTSAISQQKTDSLKSADTSQSKQQTVDSTKGGPGATAVPPTPSTIDSEAPPPEPPRVRRGMRSR